VAQPGGAPRTQLYLVDVTNRGTVKAERLRLDLFVDGAAADAADIDELKPGETHTTKISGPACSLRVRAVVDRLDTIPETTEDDNVLRSSCPLPAS
jgi:subtilase family serine protease